MGSSGGGGPGRAPSLTEAIVWVLLAFAGLGVGSMLWHGRRAARESAPVWDGRVAGHVEVEPPEPRAAAGRLTYGPPMMAPSSTFTGGLPIGL